MFSMAELEEQPIGTTQIIRNLGLPSNSFIIQGESFAQVIDLENYEHLQITETRMGKSGLLVVRTAEDKLMLYSNE